MPVLYGTSISPPYGPCPFQHFRPYRKLSYALARRCEDGSAERRSYDGHGRLTDASRCFPAFYNMGFHDRHFVHAQHLIVVEIRLDHTASVDRNFIFESGCQTEDDATFHLCFKSTLEEKRCMSVCPCVGAQTSHTFPWTWAVQFTGSIATSAISTPSSQPPSLSGMGTF